MQLLISINSIEKLGNINFIIIWVVNMDLLYFTFFFFGGDIDFQKMLNEEAGGPGGQSHPCLNPWTT